jgi:hypothetical protein
MSIRMPPLDARKLSAGGSASHCQHEICSSPPKEPSRNRSLSATNSGTNLRQ